MQILRSGVSNLYARPLYPSKGEEVFLCVHVDPSAVRWVRLAVVANGDLSRLGMAKCSEFQGYDVWQASIRAPEGELRYWFEGEMTDGADVYFSRRGLSFFSPSWESAFVLKTDLDVPSWTPGTVCYQIFPDRFCNGNPALGAHEGDYEFDGHPVHEMKWDDKPLKYLDGYCLDFFNGDLEGIASKASYLRDLGVGAVYLNPIGESRTTHRYDCTDYFHIDSKLGGDEAYVKMIRALHEAGIKVITDISINHTGIDHKWFLAAKDGREEASYYYRREDGSFDCWFNVSTLPQLNYGSEKLRKVMFEDEDSVLQKFIREPFCQDGWRLDVATCVGNHGSEHMCHEIWQKVRKAVKAINPEAYIVGEDWEDSSEYLQGDQWDATMNYIGCSRPLRRWMGEGDRYFRTQSMSPRAVRPYSAYDLKAHLESQLQALPPQMVYQQMNLIDSHDEPRLHCNSEVFNKGLYFGAVMMQFMLPGMPCIYYGDEIGLEGPVGSVEDCRYPMVWDERFWNMDFLKLYRTLSHLKHDYSEALGEGQWEFGYCSNEILEFRRFSESQKVVLVLYRGQEPCDPDCIEVAGMKDLFSGEDVSALHLEPFSSRIFVS